MSFTIAAKGQSMHSHDRTMIAKMGFQDADRGNSQHELACAFFCQRHIANLLGDLLLPETKKPRRYTITDHRSCPHTHERTGTIRQWKEHGYVEVPRVFRDRCSEELKSSYETRFDRFDLTESTRERPLLKGRDQYATTIGFLDVVLVLVPVHVFTYWDENYDPCLSGKCPLTKKDFQKTDDERGRARDFVIEVKIDKVQTSEVIRQINFYRSFYQSSPGQFEKTFWLFASPYFLDRNEKAAVEEAGITHVFLGAEFAAFAEKSKNITSDKSDLIL